MGEHVEDFDDVYADGTPVPKESSPSEETARPEVKEPEQQKPEEAPQYHPYRFDQAWQDQQINPRPYNEMPKQKEPKDSFGRRLALCALFAILFGIASGLLFVGMRQVGTYLDGRTTEPSFDVGESAAAEEEPRVTLGEDTSKSATDEVAEAESEVPKITASTVEKSVADVAEETMPAMVAITNVSVQQVYSFFGQPQTYEVPSAGSGIIVGQTDEELLIATNEHVISNHESLTVCFADDSVVEATVKGSDATNDLAIIAVALDDIEEETKDKIRVISIGNSDELRIGEGVVAIGNALGYGQSVSAGVISAVNREVTVDKVTHVLLQTDAAINPGNSGGALLNMNGELIGINEIKYASTDVEGIGYAIPITQAKPILDELMNRKTRTKAPEGKQGYLGIVCNTVTEQYSEALNIPVGVYVESIKEDSAADKAGIMTRDIITKIDGQTVATADELVRELQYFSEGESVELTVWRIGADNEYEETTVTVTLDARPADAELQTDPNVGDEAP